MSKGNDFPERWFAVLPDSDEFRVVLERLAWLVGRLSPRQCTVVEAGCGWWAIDTELKSTSRVLASRAGHFELFPVLHAEVLLVFASLTTYCELTRSGDGARRATVTVAVMDRVPRTLL